MCLVRDVAGHYLSVRLDPNDQSAAIIAEQCLQISLLIFGMIFFGKHELDRVLAGDRRAFVRGNKSQLRWLIVSLENTAYFRIGRV